MNIKETIGALKRANAILEIERDYSSVIVDCQRMLLSGEELHEVQELAKTAGALIATIETNYASYGRISPFSKIRRTKMKEEIINGFFPTQEELLEEMGYDPEAYEIEARAEREAKGLTESNIVGE